MPGFVEALNHRYLPQCFGLEWTCVLQMLFPLLTRTSKITTRRTSEDQSTAILNIFYLKTYFAISNSMAPSFVLFTRFSLILADEWQQSSVCNLPIVLQEGPFFQLKKWPLLGPPDYLLQLEAK